MGLNKLEISLEITVFFSIYSPADHQLTKILSFLKTLYVLWIPKVFTSFGSKQIRLCRLKLLSEIRNLLYSFTVERYHDEGYQLVLCGKGYEDGLRNWFHCMIMIYFSSSSIFLSFITIIVMRQLSWKLINCMKSWKYSKDFR